MMNVLSIISFVFLLGVFLSVVWYAVSNEDLRTESEKPRFGALSRALQRVRKCRSSRGWGVFDQRGDRQKRHSPAASSRAPTSTEDSLPPPP